MSDIFSRRFVELTKQYAEVAATEHSRVISSGGRTTQYMDGGKLVGWKTKAMNLLMQACGGDSVHLNQFNRVADTPPYASAGKQLLEILKAAQEDYDGGYLTSVRRLVSAELFSSELEQAEELLRTGFHVAAAVVAGTVLETTLRALCTANGQVPSNLNRMNDDLAKTGVYNALEKKNVTAMAGIRNAAAHGQTADFTVAQVEGMLRDVARFVTAHA